MAYSMISNKQLSISVLTIIVSVAACCLLANIISDYFELPEVWVNRDGTCVKVVNFKNGDGYACQDKDVILRKYVVVNVK